MEDYPGSTDYRTTLTEWVLAFTTHGRHISQLNIWRLIMIASMRGYITGYRITLAWTATTWHTSPSASSVCFVSGLSCSAIFNSVLNLLWRTWAPLSILAVYAMTVKNKKHKISLIIFGALLAYALWLTCRPVKIIAVHHTGNHSAAILVNNLPFTDRDKIAWWQENRAMLKEKYDLPAPADNGFFSVTVWLLS